jgi:ABC-2 type transport system ATP-binding protein
MIEAAGLSKFYGDFAAVRNVSFSVPQGQVAAFLGPNGAGKSTTLKILTGYLTASEGVARIAGLEVLAHRIEAARRIGYLPENGPLYPEMTPLELLRFLGEARGLSNGKLTARIDAVVDQCNLQAVLEKSIYKLSKGYRQRVGMAQAMLHDPDILIMDEPTSGLDPNQIQDVRLLIRRLGETKTILISTHILQEVRAVCGHVILINEGRVVFDGTPEGMAGSGSLEEAFHRLTGKQSPSIQTGPESEQAPPSGDGLRARASFPAALPQQDGSQAADEEAAAEPAGSKRDSDPERPPGREVAETGSAAAGSTRPAEAAEPRKAGGIL